MITKLEFKSKNAYGRALYIPVSPEAKLVCELLKVTTISTDRMRILQKLGYEIQIQPSYEENFDELSKLPKNA